MMSQVNKLFLKTTLASTLLNKNCSKQKAQVLLVSMPFGTLVQPSIGLSLLKAALTSRNIPANILYFTLKFAELISTPSYLRIANGVPSTCDLVGEWIFNSALFGSKS